MAHINVRHWILRRLGALEWLEEIEIATRRTEAIGKRRDDWQARAEASALEAETATALAKYAEKQARETGEQAWRQTLASSQEAKRRADEAVEAADKRIAEAMSERDAAFRLATAHIEVVALMLEPDFGEVCKKVRCYSQKIADKMCREVERKTGLKPHQMFSYTCDRCPPQPVTTERWWHISMVDPKLRGRRKYDEKIYMPMLDKAVDPSQLDAVRKRLFGEEIAG